MRPPFQKWLYWKQFGMLHWMPLLGAILLMGMVAFTGLRAYSKLKEAIAWRKHTVEVILAANSFQETLATIQRNAREYATVGHTNALAAYEDERRREPRQREHLEDLTRDNSVAQQRLKALATAVQEALNYSDRLTRVCREQGSEAAIEMDRTGAENRRVFGRANDIVKAFLETESELLERRGAIEQTSYQHASRLLAVDCLLAGLLLVLANLAASHELTARHRAEGKLRHALALQNAILHSADYAIVTTNLAGIIQTFNPAAERLLGYVADEVVGKETPTLWRDPIEVAERAAALSKKLGHKISPNFEYIATKARREEVDEAEWTFVRKDGSRFIGSSVVSTLTDRVGKFTGYIGIFRDITVRKSLEAEKEKLIGELKNALVEVKTLSGLIPICGWCKNVRNDSGYWQSVEHYVRAHTEATFTHSICPACQEKFKADVHRATQRGAA